MQLLLSSGVKGFSVQVSLSVRVLQFLFDPKNSGRGQDRALRGALVFTVLP